MLQQSQLSTLTSQIAQLLTTATGQSWAALPPDYNESACSLVSGELIIDIRPARELHRLSISGSTPRHLWDAHRNAYHVYAPKITVSDQRPAPAIASEITRRLLPDLRAYIAKLYEIQQRMDDYAAAKQHAINTILEAINSTPGARRAELAPKYGSEYDRIFTRQSGGPHYTFEVSNCGTIELKTSLDPETAASIARILATAPSE